MQTQRPEVIRMGGAPVLHFRPGLIVLVIIVVLAALWFIRGGPFYTVAPGEQGIVLTFGQYTSSAEPGFHFKWPWPIQSVETPNVAETKRIEIGFRSESRGAVATYITFSQDPELLEEARMLTGDENVVDCSMAIQYYIKDALAYTFNFRHGDADLALRDMAEAALRQAVGDHPIDDALTTNKFQVEDEIKTKMQELADLYQMGVSVDQVKLQDVQPPHEVANAFKKVASAREEKQKIINEAQAYEREQIPKAQGEAERLKLAASAYKDARIAEAQGAVARFQAIAKEYQAAPEVTRTRLYLETLRELLPKVRVTVVDEGVGVVNLRSLNPPALESAAPAVEPAQEESR